MLYLTVFCRARKATSTYSQRYYTTKRLIRDLLSKPPNWGYLFTGNASNRSFVAQRLFDICTESRFGRYLYSTKCSSIIKTKNCLDFRIYASSSWFSESLPKTKTRLKPSRFLCSEDRALGRRAGGWVDEWVGGWQWVSGWITAPIDHFRYIEIQLGSEA